MLEMSMTPQMEMQANPALLNLAHLLALPAMSLHQAVQQELAENPSLEELEAEETPCAVCGGTVVDGLCLNCITRPVAGEPAGAPPADAAPFDPLLLVATPRSLKEGLLVDLHASIPEQDYAIATVLVGSLDEQGFLTEEPSAIADTLNVAHERVEQVLRHLQTLGPAGIATTDTQASILAQIRELAAQGTSNPHAAAIIEHHMDELGTRRYQQIANSLGITVEQVEAAHEFIRRHLWPFPTATSDQQASAPDSTRYRSPDLAIVEKGGQFVAEVLHSPRRALRMNPLYQELIRNAATLDEDEREHVQEYVSRTRVFLSNLRQRESTLQRIGDYLVTHQHDFLRHGVRHQTSMTRAQVAADLDLHESTISRAVADKVVLLPDKTLLPLSEFFVASRSVQDIIRELIAQETTPLSDQQIVHLLAERGYKVARRTVAKYRTRMKILPSNLR